MVLHGRKVKSVYSQLSHSGQLEDDVNFARQLDARSDRSVLAHETARARQPRAAIDEL